jgi:single-strand DNA-binding protein
MNFEMKGELIHIGSATENAKGFIKSEFVIRTHDEKFPQEIKFELFKDNTKKLDDVTIGSKINVHFNIKGRPWNDKWFTSIECWKIDVIELNTNPF